MSAFLKRAQYNADVFNDASAGDIIIFTDDATTQKVLIGNRYHERSSLAITKDFSSMNKLVVGSNNDLYDTTEHTAEIWGTLRADGMVTSNLSTDRCLLKDIYLDETSKRLTVSATDDVEIFARITNTSNNGVVIKASYHDDPYVEQQQSYGYVGMRSRYQVDVPPYQGTNPSHDNLPGITSGTKDRVRFAMNGKEYTINASDGKHLLLDTSHNSFVESTLTPVIKNGIRHAPSMDAVSPPHTFEETECTKPYPYTNIVYDSSGSVYIRIVDASGTSLYGNDVKVSPDDVLAGYSKAMFTSRNQLVITWVDISNNDLYLTQSRMIFDVTASTSPTFLHTLVFHSTSSTHSLHPSSVKVLDGGNNCIRIVYNIDIGNQQSMVQSKMYSFKATYASTTFEIRDEPLPCLYIDAENSFLPTYLTSVAPGGGSTSVQPLLPVITPGSGRTFHTRMFLPSPVHVQAMTEVPVFYVGNGLDSHMICLIRHTTTEVKLEVWMDGTMVVVSNANVPYDVWYNITLSIEVSIDEGSAECRIFFETIEDRVVSFPYETLSECFRQLQHILIQYGKVPSSDITAITSLPSMQGMNGFTSSFSIVDVATRTSVHVENMLTWNPLMVYEELALIRLWWSFHEEIQILQATTPTSLDSLFKVSLDTRARGIDGYVYNPVYIASIESATPILGLSQTLSRFILTCVQSFNHLGQTICAFTSRTGTNPMILQLKTSLTNNASINIAIAQSSNESFENLVAFELIDRNVLITWTFRNASNQITLWFAIYTMEGFAVSSNIQVNTAVSVNPNHTSAVGLKSGDVVFVWDAFDPLSNQSRKVFVRSYTAKGKPLTLQESRVSNVAVGHEYFPKVKEFRKSTRLAVTYVRIGQYAPSEVNAFLRIYEVSISSHFYWIPLVGDELMINDKLNGDFIDTQTSLSMAINEHDHVICAWRYNNFAYLASFDKHGLLYLQPTRKFMTPLSSSNHGLPMVDMELYGFEIAYQPIGAFGQMIWYTVHNGSTRSYLFARHFRMPLATDVTMTGTVQVVLQTTEDTDYINDWTVDSILFTKQNVISYVYQGSAMQHIVHIPSNVYSDVVSLWTKDRRIASFSYSTNPYSVFHVFNVSGIQTTDTFTLSVWIQNDLLYSTQPQLYPIFTIGTDNQYTLRMGYNYLEILQYGIQDISYNGINVSDPFPHHYTFTFEPAYNRLCITKDGNVIVDQTFLQTRNILPEPGHFTRRPFETPFTIYAFPGSIRTLSIWNVDLTMYHTFRTHYNRGLPLLYRMLYPSQMHGLCAWWDLFDTMDITKNTVFVNQHSSPVLENELHIFYANGSFEAITEAHTLVPSIPRTFVTHVSVTCVNFMDAFVVYEDVSGMRIAKINHSGQVDISWNHLPLDTSRLNLHEMYGEPRKFAASKTGKDDIVLFFVDTLQFVENAGGDLYIGLINMNPNERVQSDLVPLRHIVKPDQTYQSKMFTFRHRRTDSSPDLFSVHPIMNRKQENVYHVIIYGKTGCVFHWMHPTIPVTSLSVRSKEVELQSTFVTARTIGNMICFHYSRTTSTMHTVYGVHTTRFSDHIHDIIPAFGAAITGIDHTLMSFDPVHRYVGIGTGFPQQAVDVQGDTVFRSKVCIEDNTRIERNTDIKGDVTIHSRLSVTEGVTFDNTMDVSGEVVMASTLFVYGCATFMNGIVIKGGILFNNDISPIPSRSILEDTSNIVHTVIEEELDVPFSTIPSRSLSFSYDDAHKANVSVNGIASASGSGSASAYANGGLRIDFSTLYGVRSDYEVTEYISGRVNISNTTLIPQSMAWTVWMHSSPIENPNERAVQVTSTLDHTVYAKGSYVDLITVPLLSVKNYQCVNADNLYLTLDSNVDKESGAILQENDVLYIGDYIPNTIRFRSKFVRDFLHTHMEDVKWRRVYSYQFVECSHSKLREDGSKLFIIAFLMYYDLPQYLYLHNLSTNAMSFYASTEGWSENSHAYCRANGVYCRNKFIYETHYPCITLQRWFNDANQPTVTDVLYDHTLGWGDPYPTIQSILQRYTKNKWLEELYRITYRYLFYHDVHSRQEPVIEDWSSVFVEDNLSICMIPFISLQNIPIRYCNIRIFFHKHAFNTA
jgi:hypothetical protein